MHRHNTYPNSASWHDIYHANLMAALLSDEKELINHGFEIANPLNRLIVSEARGDKVEFFEIMRDWILNGEPLVTQEMIVYNPNAVNYPTIFSDRHLGAICVAYGPRVISQLKYVCDMLEINPDSRRANMMILTPEDRFVGKALEKGETKCEYPCTLGFNFRLRGEDRDILDMNVSMRSNNYVTTVTQDVYVFTAIQEHVAAVLGVEVGTYYHHTMSGHVLPRDYGKARAIMDEYISKTDEELRTISWDHSIELYEIKKQHGEYDAG